MAKEHIVGGFVVRIKTEKDLSDAKLDMLCGQICDALDDIQFNQIIRQKLDEHHISGVKIEVIQD